MKKIVMLSGITAITIGAAILLPKTVSAYRGDPAVQGPNYTAERHEAMEKAFANNDYNTWKSLMVSRGRVTQVVNAQNFARFAEAHRLAEQGKMDEANKIRTELGLGLQNGSGQGMGYGHNR